MKINKVERFRFDLVTLEDGRLFRRSYPYGEWQGSVWRGNSGWRWLDLSPGDSFTSELEDLYQNRNIMIEVGEQEPS